MVAAVKAEVRGSVDLKPAKSQGVLVALLAVSGLALCLSAGMFYADKDAPGWVLLLIGAGVAAATFRGWKQAQADTDLDKAHPTKVVLADGAHLSMDPRAIRSDSDADRMLRLIEILSTRQPLPAATGLLDESGRAVPNSAKAATEVVERINATVVQDAQLAARLLAGRDGEGRLTVSPIDVAGAGPTEAAPAIQPISALEPSATEAQRAP